MEVAPLVSKYGIGGIGVPRSLMEDEQKALEAGKCVASYGLKWGLMPTPVDFYAEKVSDAEFSEGLEKLKRWADLGEKMGLKYSYNHVWNGSNSREFAENYEWNLTRIKQVWKVMDDHGIAYGMEFLGPHPLQKSFTHPFINNIAGILALASDVNERCGFLFDTYHWFCGSAANMGDLYLAARNVDKIVNFHVNDGILGRSYAEQEDRIRAVPFATGVIDSVTPYRMLDESGYTGPILIEALWPFIDEQKQKSTEDAVKTVASIYDRLKAAADRKQ